jgi:hypothetical protein
MAAWVIRAEPKHRRQRSGAKYASHGPSSEATLQWRCPTSSLAPPGPLPPACRRRPRVGGPSRRPRFYSPHGRGVITRTQRPI